MYENELRDILAANIEFLEPGLTLLDKEQYIPNSICTRGFIDLYAKDEQNHHVLIEIKRSDAAAREAIHEVLKYVEGVKQYFGARDDEIRVVIASTEWRELLAPYSRFLKETTINVSGYLLNIDSSSKSIVAEIIEPLKITKGRYLAPWHDLNMYENETSLRKGIESCEASCKHKGVNDYVIVTLRAPEGLYEAALEGFTATLMRMREQHGFTSPASEIDDIVSRMPEYKYIAYFAMQMLSREACLEIIALSPEQMTEVNECLPGMDEEEALCYLHETVSSIDSPHRDHYEIGYPAKFSSKLLQDEGWIIEKVLRFGAFQRNALLTDDEIISELSGETGATRQRFKRNVSIANRSQISASKAELRTCLAHNPVWQAHLQRHLSEIELDYPNAELQISVYNPCAGVITIFQIASREDGILYNPTYHIVVTEQGEPRRIYYGCLQGSKATMTYHDVINKYYGGDLFALLFTSTWGGYEQRDTEILEDLGLHYTSYRCDINGDDRIHFALQNERWLPSSPLLPHEPVMEYFHDNERLIKTIVMKIAPRLNGGIFDGSSPHHQLEAMIDLERGQREKIFYVSPPDECDVCGCSLKEEQYMIDGALKGHPAWANMCGDCFYVFGKGIGWGKGQLYLNQTNGWLLVGGFESSSRRKKIRRKEN